MATNVRLNTGNLTLHLSGRFQFSRDPERFLKLLEGEMFSKGPNSPFSAMKQLGNEVKAEVLRQYDSTRSAKNSNRRTGKLRSLITRQGPFISRAGEGKSEAPEIVVKIGSNMPPHWVFAEFGTKPSLRQQTFQVIGKGSYGQPVAGASREILNSQRFAALNRLAGGGLKLIPRKKEELARIKRKVTLEFTHPGFKGGFFIRAGALYAASKGQGIINAGFQRMFDSIDLKMSGKA